MTGLRVIEGGRSLSPGSADQAPSIADLVGLAEGKVCAAAQLIAPGMAIVCKTEVELANIVGTVDLVEAVRTHSIFRDGVAAARGLLETLQRAEARLSVAINTVARQEAATSPDGR
jgi:hypothetical protein